MKFFSSNTEHRSWTSATKSTPIIKHRFRQILHFFKSHFLINDPPHLQYAQELIILWLINLSPHQSGISETMEHPEEISATYGDSAFTTLTTPKVRIELRSLMLCDSDCTSCITTLSPIRRNKVEDTKHDTNECKQDYLNLNDLCLEYI